MNKFMTILLKEMKDLLRDPKILFGMILVPLIMFPALGFMFRTSLESVEQKTEIGVINSDGGAFSNVFITALENDPAVSLTKFENVTANEAIARAEYEDVKVLLVIPEEFTETIQDTSGAEVEVYAVVQGLGMGEIISTARIDEVIARINRQLSKTLIEERMPGIDPVNVLTPIRTHGYTVVKGKTLEVPPALIANLINSQSFVVPVILLMMIMFVAQMAATSMATEKENKTLETLLTLPVSRFSILAGKMGGTAVVSIIAAVAYIIGFSFYMSSFQIGPSVPISLEDIGLTMSPFGFGLLALSIFMAVLAALSLSMILAVFTEDVRSAQSLVSFTIMPLVFPALVLMFTDLNSLPLAFRLVLLALPFSHPTIAAKAVILGDYGIVIGGIGYLAVFTHAVLYIAARMFSTERVVTAKIRFGRKEKRSK